jgi:hypothetical protein
VLAVVIVALVVVVGVVSCEGRGTSSRGVK